MTTEGKKENLSAYQQLMGEIRRILEARQGRTAAALSQEMIEVYWKIGERLAYYEERATNKSRFNAEFFPRLSKDLTGEFGEGFSEVNLRAMRRFYQNTRNKLSLGQNRPSWLGYLRFNRYESGEGGM